MMEFRAKDESNPEMVEAAKICTLLVNAPEFKAQLERRTMEEFMRQYFYGLEPSEGIPDVRPNRPRYQG